MPDQEYAAAKKKAAMTQIAKQQKAAAVAAAAAAAGVVTSAGNPADRFVSGPVGAPLVGKWISVSFKGEKRYKGHVDEYYQGHRKYRLVT